MESGSETWVTMPGRVPTVAGREACLVHIYPTGPGMGARYPLGDTPLVIGRGNDADIRINDNSVSRRHARIQPGADGYYAVDLQSTNGTFVNDVPASICKLKDGDYLRVGNCIYRFLAGGNVEAEYHEEIYRLTIIDGLTDAHNGLRVFNKQVADGLNLTMSGMSHADEFISLACENHWRVTEEPVEILYTEYSMSKGQPLLNGVNIIFDGWLRGRMSR